jgi:hypothetical protein
MGSQRPHRSGKRNARQQPRRPRPARSASRGANRGNSARSHEPDLLAEIRRSLATGKPLDLLADVSSLVAALDPRRNNPFAPPGDNDGTSVTLGELVQTFAEVDTPETSALLSCLGQMAADDLVRARARRAIGQRGHALPDWLRRLGETTVYRAVEMVDVLGDGDELILGVRLPAGHEITLLVYIDHNMGTLVKDAFPAPETIAGVLAAVRSRSDSDLRLRKVSLADARARITEAIDVGAITLPPLESETWPACRPLVEWALRLMPDGGTGHQRPDWSEAETRALADDFFASPFGAPLDDFDHRQLLESILWFGTDHGPGDPMRWSPVAVEMLLIDWIPRTLPPDVKYLAKAPELVRAFARYCHDARGIRPGLTAETLASVDRFEPEYQRLIRSPRLQGPDALLDAIGALDAEDASAFVPRGGDDHYAEFAYGEEYMLGRLAETVGGEAALDALDDEPLPDEAFSWTGVPDDIRPAVAEVLRSTDEFCERVLDREYRTAARRLLARIATGDAAVFRRKASPVVSAAAICWIIGKANELFGLYGHGMLVKDMMARFGLRSSAASQRAATFLKAAGINPDQLGAMRLGSADLLVSARRRNIMAARDRCRAELAGQ